MYPMVRLIALLTDWMRKIDHNESKTLQYHYVTTLQNLIGVVYTQNLKLYSNSRK